MSFEVQSLAFAYAHQPVLQGVSLALPAGHFYGILGPNGCGKTTLLDLLAGHRQPTTGAIRYRGRDLGGYARRALAQDTRVLLLDEATSNLDIGHCLELLALTAQAVRTAGKTVIAVFQDINLAAAFCDRLVFIKAGAVVAHGETAEVLRAEVLREIFGVSARVSYNSYCDAQQVVFRKSAA